MFLQIEELFERIEEEYKLFGSLVRHVFPNFPEVFRVFKEEIQEIFDISHTPDIPSSMLNFIVNGVRNKLGSAFIVDHGLTD